MKKEYIDKSFLDTAYSKRDLILSQINWLRENSIDRNYERHIIEKEAELHELDDIIESYLKDFHK